MLVVAFLFIFFTQVGSEAFGDETKNSWVGSTQSHSTIESRRFLQAAESKQMVMNGQNHERRKLYSFDEPEVYFDLEDYGDREKEDQVGYIPQKKYQRSYREPRRSRRAQGSPRSQRAPRRRYSARGPSKSRSRRTHRRSYHESAVRGDEKDGAGNEKKKDEQKKDEPRGAEVKDNAQDWSIMHGGSCPQGKNILGQYKADVGENPSKTFNLPCGDNTVTLTMDFYRIDNWAGETAYVSVNGRRVWTKKGDQKNGKNICGDKKKNDEIWKVAIPDVRVKRKEMTVEVGVDKTKNTTEVWWGFDQFSYVPKCIEPTVLKDKEEYRDNLKDWTLTQTTECGSFGTILGGFDVLGGPEGELAKKFVLPCKESTLSMKFKFARLDGWSGNTAFVEVNGKRAWTQEGDKNNGANNECGQDGKDQLWDADVRDFAVDGTDLKLRFGTDLTESANSASWGIKDLVITPVCKPKAPPPTLVNSEDFKDDMKGWNFKEMSTCGDDEYLGGYKLLGKDAKLVKKYKLPCENQAVTVQFNFMRIDEWNGEKAWAKVNGEEIWSMQGKKENGEPVCGKEDINDELVKVESKELKLRAKELVLEIGSDIDGDGSVASWGVNGVKLNARCLGGETKRFEKFGVTLGEMNGVPARAYVLTKAETTRTEKRWSPFMREQCEKWGMKPICDHKEYCKKDSRSLWMGQSGHLAYPEDRLDESKVPKHFDKIAEQFNGVCTYTGQDGSGKALCNIPVKKHKWLSMQEEKANTFMCGKLAVFEASLEKFNGLPARTYQFRVVTTANREGRFSDLMVKECEKYKMKPVCDHPKSCKDDEKAVWLGQTHHLAHPGHRKNAEFWPKGWDGVLQSAFDGLCAYTGVQGSGKALCNQPVDTHKWMAPSSDANSFMCAKELKVTKPHKAKKLKMQKEDLSSWRRVNADDAQFPSSDHAILPKGGVLESNVILVRPVTVELEMRAVPEKSTEVGLADDDEIETIEYDEVAVGFGYDYVDNEAEVGFDYEFYAEDHYDAEADEEAAANSDIFDEVETGADEDTKKVDTPSKPENKDDSKDKSSEAGEKGKETDKISEPGNTGAKKTLGLGKPEKKADKPGQKAYKSSDDSKDGKDRIQKPKDPDDKDKPDPRPKKDDATEKPDTGNALDAIQFSLFNNKLKPRLGLAVESARDPSTAKKGVLRTFPGKQEGKEKKMGSNAEWHTIRIEALADGTTKYYLNNNLFRTVRIKSKSGKLKEGKMSVIATGSAMEVRNVMVTDTPIMIKISDRNLFLHAEGGIKDGAKQTLSACPADKPLPECQWQLQESKTKPNHYYIKVASEDLYLQGNSGGSEGLGGRTLLSSVKKKDDNPSFQWEIIPSPSKSRGYYYIKISDTDLFLLSEGGSTGGAKNSIGKCDFFKNQPECQWKIRGWKGGVKADAEFKADLKAKNGIPDRAYVLQKLRTGAKHVNFGAYQRKQCGYFGMRPICDNKENCGDDARALYLGNDDNLAFPETRADKKKVPENFEKIAGQFDGACTFLAKQTDGKTLCNAPKKTHTMRRMGEKGANNFLCGRVDEFRAEFQGEGSKGGEKYAFRMITTYHRGANFSAIMTDECRRIGMKPVCAHPKWCADDDKSIYLGQTGHIANPKARDEIKDFPGGWAQVKDNFAGVCLYAGKKLKDKALCNIPLDAMHKSSASDKANTFMCAKIRKELPAPKTTVDTKFEGTLGGSDKVAGLNYKFAKITTEERSEHFGQLMRAKCLEQGMKPVCDSPEYCEHDSEAIYLGQKKNLAHPKMRENEAYVPKGFLEIATYWNGTCGYTGGHGGGKALCNIPQKSQQWYYPQDHGANSFICGQLMSFNHTFDDQKNGIPGREIEFRIVTTAKRGVKSYTQLMIDECKKHAMKPICDHPKYCKDDPSSLYLGQTKHIAYRAQRKKPENFPAPWDAKITGAFDNLCLYSGKEHGGGKAICNVPFKSHSWQMPTEKSDSFMCGRVVRIISLERTATIKGPVFTATFEAKNEVPGRKYEFRKLQTGYKKGDWSPIMIEECASVGMKPICEHPKYCKGDPKALYIGQTDHLAFPKHRAKEYVPEGFVGIASNWDGACGYTNEYGGGKALCNVPAKTHSWQAIPKGSTSFICGRIAPFTKKLKEYGQTPWQNIEFSVVTIDKYEGKFSDLMVSECAKTGAKPICDHPDYCANDEHALYLGQKKHIAFPPQRANSTYFPKGWADISENWDGLCSYAGKEQGGKALCNMPIKTHTWKKPSADANSFMCGKLIKQGPPVKKPKCDEQLRSYNDRGYRGCQDTTVSGYKCQKWTEQTPQKHKRTPEKSPGRGLGDHNHCRNPDDAETIWCFTTNPNKRWEICKPNDEMGIYTELVGDCGKEKLLATHRHCSLNCCKQQCNRDRHCKGFSFTEKGHICKLREKKCKKQPGKCDAKKGECFYAQGVVKKKVWKYYRLRGDCEGNKLKNMHKVDRKKCQKECDKDIKCEGISYNEESKMCTLRSKQCDHRQGKCGGDKFCFWTKGTPKKIIEKDPRSGGVLQMKWGYDYPGKDLKQIKRVETAMKCNTHCLAEPDCHAWVWGMKEKRSYTNVCFLKTASKKMRKNSCCVAGLPKRKQQPGYDRKQKKKLEENALTKLRKKQRLERLRTLRRIKRNQKLDRLRKGKSLRSKQRLKRLDQMKDLRRKQAKIRKLFLCRLSGKCKMPSDKPPVAPPVKKIKVKTKKIMRNFKKEVNKEMKKNEKKDEKEFNRYKKKIKRARKSDSADLAKYKPSLKVETILPDDPDSDPRQYRLGSQTASSDSESSDEDSDESSDDSEEETSEEDSDEESEESSDEESEESSDEESEDSSEDDSEDEISDEDSDDSNDDSDEYALAAIRSRRSRRRLKRMKT